ncbi:hypothetical protein B0H14DRAFT_2478375 [Mycena olivaceomarginata]|nr:hypothetical protein B0H14DRAFT_2478375 [Mycena olivaceomarginata]
MSPDYEPPVYSESRIYSNLLCQGRGFPLYRPEPPTRLPKESRWTDVAIGDVGTVTVEGDFDIFFNIYLPANDTINIDAPEDFVSLLAYCLRDISDYHFDPGNHVSTDSIYERNGSFHNSTLGRDFVFNCMGPNGAVLALPHARYLEKLRKLTFIQQYAAKNAKSWYKYLNKTRGCELVNGSLFLIMGGEKARLWGMATFHHVSRQNKFQLLFSPTTDAEDGFKYRWQGAYCYCKHANSSLDDGPLNQTTFIHAFMTSIPETIWETLFGDVAFHQLVDLPPPTDKSGCGFMPHGSQGLLFTSFFSFFGRNAPTEGRQCTGQDGIILHASPIPKIFHPSQVIYMHLLHQALQATVAIIHNDDWHDALLNHEVPLTKQEFIQAIFDHFKITIEMVLYS